MNGTTFEPVNVRCTQYNTLVRLYARTPSIAGVTYPSEIQVWDRTLARYRWVNLHDRSDPLWPNAKVLHEQQRGLDAMHVAELAQAVKEGVSMNRTPDSSLAVALVALSQPDRSTGRRIALMMADGSSILFRNTSSARALIWRESLQELSLPELLSLGRMP